MVNINKDSFRGNAVLFKPSRFKTVVIDVTNDNDPQHKIISTIENQDLEDCVVKIIYSVKPEQVDFINVGKIREKLTKTSFSSITSVVVQSPSRITTRGLDATLYKSPLKALEKYLDQKPDLDKKELMRKASLLSEELARSGR